MYQDNMAVPQGGLVRRTWDENQRRLAAQPPVISDEQRFKNRAHELLAENARLEAEDAEKRRRRKEKLVKARIDIVRRRCTAEEFAYISDWVADPEMGYAQDGSGHELALKRLRDAE